MYLYNRSKHCYVKLAGDAILIHSAMIDDMHEMVLDMVIGLNDMIIQDISFVMLRTPVEICKEVQKNARSMVGERIGPGISKIAKERIGGAAGCYHLLDLFLEGAKVCKQGYSRYLRRNNDREAMEATLNNQKDTCYMWSNKNKKI